MKRKVFKGCPPRVSRICIVDDDADRRRQLREFINLEFPKLSVSVCESVFGAYRSSGRFDYLIIDVSSVAPQMLSDIDHAWGPICKFMEQYPGTEIIILSAMSRNATEDVIEDVRKYNGNPRMVHYGGTGEWDSHYPGESLKAKLHELIKPVDMEWTDVKRKDKSK